MTYAIQYCLDCKEYYTTQEQCPFCAESRKAVGTSIMQKVHSAITPTKIKRGKWAHMGMAFDSKPEALRYEYLAGLQVRGVIRHLCVQPTAILRPAYALSGRWYTRTKSGKARTISAETYTPDYCYVFRNTLIIEDVKGVKKGKPYSKPMSNVKQYTLQARYANRDDVLFMLVCNVKGVWKYFQQSHGYPELYINFNVESE